MQSFARVRRINFRFEKQWKVCVSAINMQCCIYMYIYGRLVAQQKRLISWVKRKALLMMSGVPLADFLVSHAWYYGLLYSYTHSQESTEIFGLVVTRSLAGRLLLLLVLATVVVVVVVAGVARASIIPPLFSCLMQLYPPNNWPSLFSEPDD